MLIGTRGVVFESKTIFLPKSILPKITCISPSKKYLNLQWKIKFQSISKINHFGLKMCVFSLQSSKSSYFEQISRIFNKTSQKSPKMEFWAIFLVCPQITTNVHILPKFVNLDLGFRRFWPKFVNWGVNFGDLGQILSIGT